MKYLSLIAVIVFISLTFWFTKRAEELSIDQMNKMNELITEYMKQAVKNNQPEASDIEFSKIYTEVIESGKKMKAHFKFSYMEPNKDGEMEKVYRKGTFLITSDDGQQWKAQIESAGDVKVEFMAPFSVEEGEASTSDDSAEEKDEGPQGGANNDDADDEMTDGQNPEEETHSL